MLAGCCPYIVGCYDVSAKNISRLQTHGLCIPKHPTFPLKQPEYPGYKGDDYDINNPMIPVTVIEIIGKRIMIIIYTKPLQLRWREGRGRRGGKRE